MSEPTFVKPSAHFSDYEVAIEAVCEGCPRENGWAFMDGMTGEPCVGMIKIQDDDPSIILCDDQGHFSCVMKECA